MSTADELEGWRRGPITPLPIINLTECTCVTHYLAIVDDTEREIVRWYRRTPLTLMSFP